MATDKFKIAVLLSGRGSNFEALAKAIETNKLPIEIELVVSDKKDARGLALAKERGFKTALIERKPKERSADEFFKEIGDAVSAAKPDLVVLAGFMRVLNAAFIKRFAGKMINIHPSLLPSFPGLDAQRQAWEAQVRFSGCSVHFVTEEVDAGPIIAQAIVPLFPCDTAEDLQARILIQEHKLLPAVVAALAKKDVWLEEKDGRPLVMFRGKLNDLEKDAGLLSIKPL